MARFRIKLHQASTPTSFHPMNTKSAGKDHAKPETAVSRTQSHPLTSHTTCSKTDKHSSSYKSPHHRPETPGTASLHSTSKHPSCIPGRITIGTVILPRESLPWRSRPKGRYYIASQPWTSRTCSDHNSSGMRCVRNWCAVDGDRLAWGEGVRVNQEVRILVCGDGGIGESHAFLEVGCGIRD